MQDITASNWQLSASEFGVWLVTQSMPEAFNIRRTWELRGELAENSFRAAVTEAVARHQVFSRRLSVRDGAPLWIAGEAAVSWVVADAADAGAAGWEDAARPYQFDLATDCPVRAVLIRRGERRYLFSLLVHHIACDGMSFEILLKDIGTAYGQRVAGGPPLPPPAPFPWPADSADAGTGYWLRHLDGAQWPDAMRCSTGPRTFRADMLSVPLRAAEADLLRRGTRRLRVTPHVLGLTALHAALAVYGSPCDTLVAVPFAGRTTETMGVVGCLARLVPIRQQWSQGFSGTELTQSVRRTITEALAHSGEPIHQAAELFDPAVPGTTVTFQVREPDPVPVLYGIEVIALRQVSGCTRLDVEFELHLRADGGELTATRRAEGGPDRGAVEGLLQTFRQALTSIARDPGRRILAVSGPRADLAFAVIRSAPSARAPRPLMARFADLVATIPERPAVSCGPEVASFASLARTAAGIAAALREHGAKPGAPVGVLAERGISLVASVLAVWQTGGYVIPLDPLMPDARLRYVASDTGTMVLLRSPRYRDRLVGFTHVVELTPELGARPPVSSCGLPDEGALAYVIHTSGTTGQPKGVMVEHRGLAAYADAQVAGLGAVRVGLTCAVSFDAFFLQLLHLFRGSCLAVADEAVFRDPQALVSWVRQRDVRFLSITPSLYGAMRQFDFEDVVKNAGMQLELAAEAVDAATWRRVRELGVPATNAYGPTEVTIQTTSCRFDEQESPGIGAPLPGTSAYVLTLDLRPVPRDVAGELYLAGPQVSRGYLNNPALTASRFLPDPFADSGGTRMFRTGDRVRMTPRGRLEYLQRMDHQLKIRGQRVDPFELEAVLRAIPGVQDAYVARHSAVATGKLHAYLIPGKVTRTPRPGEIRVEIARQLPAAAVPSHITFVGSFPLTPGGKVDERALPESTLENDAGPPDDLVARAWREATDHPVGEADDNFFASGGTSLDAARLIAAVNRAAGAEIELASFFRDPSPAGLQHLLDISSAARAVGHGVTEKAPEGISAAQRRLWLLHRIDPASSEFTVCWAVRLANPPSRTAVETAWRDLLTAHEELRLRVFDGAREPRRGQWPVEAMRVRWRSARGANIDDLLREAMSRSFQLSAEPLLELQAVRLGNQQHAVIFSGHHIVLDRHSIHLITTQFLDGIAGIRLAAPRRRYQEAAEPDGDRVNLLRKFWMAELDGAICPALTGKREATDRRESRTLRRAIEANAWAQVTESARAQRTTPLVLSMAAFAVAADRYGAGGDVVVGTTMDTRPPGFEDTVGLFVNPVPVRLRPFPAATGRDLVKGVHEAMLRSHAHRDLPFDVLVQATRQHAEPGRSPLFDVLMEHDRQYPMVGRPERIEVPEPEAKYDLEIILRESPNGAWLEASYRADRWDESRLADFVARVHGALMGLAVHPDFPPSAPVGGAGDQRVLDWGRGAVLTGAITLAGDLVDQMACLHPEQVAVIAENGRLSYRELRSSALAVSARLRCLGIRPGDRVAIAASRSTWMIIAVLGAVFAGAAYVPVDPDQPVQRVQAMLADCGAVALLTTRDAAERGRRSGIPVVEVEQASAGRGLDAPVPVRPEDPAYVIYTSGSTGRPKGVLIEHRSLGASTAARRAAYSDNQVFLLLSALAFDSSAAVIWGALTSGGCVVVAAADEVPDPEGLIRRIESCAVTHMLCVPSLYTLLLDAAEASGGGSLRSLGEVIIAGDVLPDEILTRHFRVLPGVRLVNEYGPTETAVWASYHRYLSAAPVDIGTPVPGYRLYVLDHALRPTPQGVDGELFIGGPGVAQGYLNQPGATAAAFLPDPFGGQPGGRMFRTSDRVRWTPRGTLQFLGRTDDQIKVRGHRIAPAEVEQVLRAADGVRDAAVVAHSPTALTAFVVGPADPDLVRRAARDVLPGYMVPDRIHVVDRLPLSENGKLDRRRLEREAAERATTPAAGPGVLPTPGRNADVAAAWSDVLGIPDIPEEANFFDVGGHSLLMPTLQEALWRRTGVRLAVADLFRYTTVAEIAARLNDRPPGVDGTDGRDARRCNSRAETARRMRRLRIGGDGQ
ncbi:MAG TPA: amino acid adenylation domain-containing protein [Streptosporangiaceae bacterium]